MEHRLLSFFVSCVLVIRNTFRLLYDPYKTMRSIAKENDYFQVGIILVICCGYFAYAASIRSKTIDPFTITPSALVAASAFVINFLLSVCLLYVFGRIFEVKQTHLVRRLLHLSAYSLQPAFIWFMLTSTFFWLIPPPRHETPLGFLFSIFFIFYSLILLDLRIMMLYMTIRFALRTSFLNTVKIMATFLSLFLPYSLLLYKLGIFRVPFI